MVIEVFQNEEISGEEENGVRKGIGSAFHQKRANRESINIKE